MKKFKKIFISIFAVLIILISIISIIIILKDKNDNIIDNHDISDNPIPFEESEIELFSSVSDIGLLFDVSGSMQKTLELISKNNYNIREDELENILDRIIIRENIQKDEKVRIFSLLFGGIKEPIYDLFNLLNISDNIMNFSLESLDIKASKKKKDIVKR